MEYYKRTIKGRVYDPSTAALIAEIHNGDQGPTWACVSLYRKRNGEFFLHGTGGPESEWRKLDPETGEYTDGQEIKPVSYAVASTWAASVLSPSEHAAIFAPASDDKQKLTLSISASALEDLKRTATIKRKSLSAVVEMLIAKYATETDNYIL